MTTLTIDNSNFQEKVLNAQQAVIIDFWAPWCGPCKAIAPFLEDIATQLSGQVVIGKVNIDESPELAAKYGVRSIPTLIAFKNGEVQANMVGAAPKTRLEEWIKTHTAA